MTEGTSRRPRVLIVDNFQIRRYGKVREGAGQRFLYGAVRNDWRVMTFSERDVARYLSPLGFLRTVGARLMNRRLVETARNFRPDLVLLGNCDYVSNAALEEIRAALPQVRLVHINVDALWQEHTCAQIEARKESCDAIFVTTAGEKLKTWVTGRNVVGYLPNPCDASIDGAVPAVDPLYDLFFAGVGAADDPRVQILETVVSRLGRRVKMGVFGCLGNPPLRGADYEAALRVSAAALNLNRREGWKWYSSDRIVHLMANGVLTFLSAEGGFQTFFKPDEEAVFFSDADDLVRKIEELAGDPVRRRRIAAAGRSRYFKLFNAARILRYIHETACGLPYSEPYEWAQEVYR